MRHHHRFDQWDFGYDLSGGERYEEITYRHTADSTMKRPKDSAKLRNHIFSLGGSAVVNLSLGKVVYLNLNYQPQVLCIAENTNWQYDHMVVLGWDFTLG